MLKKFLLPLFALSILAACTQNEADLLNDDAAPSDDAVMQDDAMADDTAMDHASSSAEAASSDDAMGEGSSSESSMEDGGTDDDAAADARVIEVSVDDWEFSPNAITASVGEKVVVRLTGVAGKHSLAIPELGINVLIEPGETKDVPLPTDTAGTFAFRCAVPCGPGHRDMTGTFIVS